MRSEFGYAWGKLYLAMRVMAISAAPLPQRVAEALRHLSSLGAHNLPALGHERLRALRARLVGPDRADDDNTMEPRPLGQDEATAIAEEIFSLYDEVARGRTSAPAA